MFNLLIDLVYPRLCNACGEHLQQKEPLICTTCFYKLPRTGYHNWPENPLSKVFWGRVELEKAIAFLYFTKGGKVQHILHGLKYKNLPELGELMGTLYANDLMKDGTLDSIDSIIPVPLHPEKLKARGYNQSEAFAKGLCTVSGIAMDCTSLVRKFSSSTQTKKSRYRRWENVKEIFSLEHPEVIEGKHVLLVDDVITTGATIEACCNVLLEANNVKISIAGIATAM